MTPGARGAGERIVVLQSRQPLTADLREAFPADRFSVLVLRDGTSGPVVREDAPGPVPEVVAADRDGWEGLLRRMASEGPLQVVANDEYCVEACARLRAALGLPARHPAVPAHYLDKVLMKERLRAAGVRVPRFLPFAPAVRNSPDARAEVTRAVGLPAVVKPCREANSRGVEIIASESALADWLAAHDGEPGWQVEEHLDGSLHHVNALVRDGRIEHVQAGGYLGPLLGLEDGVRYGGYTVPADHPLTAQARELNARVIDALGADGSFVAHTEFVLTGSGEPVVLETAARAPGALLSEMARVHAGTNLEVANLRMQAGLEVPPPRPGGTLAAWLWVPVRAGERPAEVPTLPAGHRLHLTRAGRDGHQNRQAVLGVSLLLWNTDLAGLLDDVEGARGAAWFQAAGALPRHRQAEARRTS
ncbi:ATP-grasp domain-containing protein [Actinomadura rugatobispora]|uniref:Acetyl-CoA carboxylase biotin carboxylase subunit family protein n=1 Tax=Actinomadura rugatobispora TaxID=1994 RepID=A0ABW0ZXR9_9ACTN|nr:hypothetical protein GCM10010200_104150 [Actinomadura rugatobispora]